MAKLSMSRLRGFGSVAYLKQLPRCHVVKAIEPLILPILTAGGEGMGVKYPHQAASGA